MDYLDWNDCLAGHFFSPIKEGEHIYLCLDRDSIVRLGRQRDLRVEFSDFLDAVCTGPPWASRKSTGICDFALDSIRGWRSKSPQRTYPPYFAYLALFVAAASLEGEWSTNAYYPRLRELLGEPTVGGTYPGFDDMSWLWADLEKWSNIDKGGQWGIFRHFLYGSWKHVGLPIAQTLLTEDDRRALPALFAFNAFDPQSPPREDEFLSILAKHGENVFRSRTLSLLRSAQGAGGTNARQALTTLLLAELRDWNGEVTQSIYSHLPQLRSANSDFHISEEYDSTESFVASTGTLRLGCRFDPIAETLSCHLRCKTPAEFPEDGFRFCLGSDQSSVEILGEEQGDGWSEPLTRRDNRRVLDAAEFDWSQPFVLEDDEQAWSFRCRGADVRLLIDARSEGLSGYIEVFRLAQGVPVLIMTHSSLLTKVDEWGNTACRNWKRLPHSSGVPRSWTAFCADAVCGDAPKKAPHPVLCPASSVSILLRGGIRVGSGNRFFDFALPQVDLQGNGELLLFCNDHQLARGDNGLFPLPLATSELQLEARQSPGTDKDVVARLAAYSVRDQWNWKQPQPQQWFNAAGSLSAGEDETAATIAGSAVEASELAPFHFGGVIPITDGGTVHFIGRVPGQISRGTARPQGWEPVWAIVSRKKGQSYFCALDVTNAQPVSLLPARAVKKDVKEWCEWLYTKRKDIAPPAQSDLRELWNSYVSTAQKLR